MKKGLAIQIANQMEVQENGQHYVVWDPKNLKESLTLSGYQVKSESEMIEDYGSVEDYALMIAYVTTKVS